MKLLRAWLLVFGLAALGYFGWKTAERERFQHTPVVVIQAEEALAGKIDIPRLNISATFKEGVDDDTLDLAVGHIPETARPGENGNVCMAAHRDTMFRNLRNVRLDDRITLTTAQGAYVYRVISTKIVRPTDVSVLAATPNSKTLTLVTCYPFYFIGDAPRRFIVRAVQVS